MRIKTTIRIDEQTLKSAQELGLNVSKACENALKIYINALTNAKN
ncbi:MAG: type II toxin-antitoxin system CcdA family antitoxin [Candidatus Bathyarchaeota archaeon]|nr:type II toxin-antitoxin system CcdA family antitoxin [Candidatus Bathyarchaeota archaeon]MDH5746377.1 type II toxin-antitoxin system CcdA family antitoxin [Candidatus Bathyarchaeota archaeon]